MSKGSGKGRGRLSERIFLEALELLKSRGKIDGYQKVPLDFAARNTRYRGIDWIVIKGRLGFPLQTKSSQRGVDEHYGRYNIPAIISVRDGKAKARASITADRIEVAFQRYPQFWTRRYSLLFQELSSLSQGNSH